MSKPDISRPMSFVGDGWVNNRANLEEPKPPAHQPVHMTLTVKDRTVANAEKLSCLPQQPEHLLDTRTIYEHTYMHTYIRI